MTGVTNSSLNMSGHVPCFRQLFMIHVRGPHILAAKCFNILAGISVFLVDFETFRFFRTSRTSASLITGISSCEKAEIKEM